MPRTRFTPCALPPAPMSTSMIHDEEVAIWRCVACGHVCVIELDAIDVACPRCRARYALRSGEFPVVRS